MGRQIRFFMSKADEHDLLKVMIENNHLILDNKSKIITLEEAVASKDLILFIAPKNLEIALSVNGFIAPIKAEVIEFSRCREWKEKVLSQGRFWVELKYWNESQQLCTKSKQFEEIYKLYVKWLKKRYRISKDKCFYIGPNAYNQYKNEGYKMQHGPKYFVEFD